MRFGASIFIIFSLPLAGIATVAIVGGIFGAILTLIGRTILYMANAQWITSACEAATTFELDGASWCGIDTNWKGFNEIYHWAVNSFDMSLLLLFVGTAVFVASWFTILMVGRFMPASAKN